MNKLECPKCEMLTLRAGAIKCPGCRAWVGPKPRRSLRALDVLLAAVGLSLAGVLVSGGAILLGARLSGHRVPLPWASSSRPSVPPAEARAASAGPSASESGAVAPRSSSSGALSAAPASSSAGERALSPEPPRSPGGEAPAAADLFSEPRPVRTSAAPLDAIISDDDQSLFVLGDDGAVRMHELASGREVRKMLMPGRGSELRVLAGKLLAVLGVPGVLPIVDLSTFIVGRVDLGGAASDILALDGAPSFVAATGASRKIVRVAMSGYKPEGQVVLSRPIAGLMKARASGRELVAVLAQSKPEGGLGSVDIFDPAAAPFGATRQTFAVAVAPRRGLLAEESLFVLDKSGSQLIEVRQDKPPRVVDVGQGPLSAHRLHGRWIVTVDAAGTATVVAAGTLAVAATLPLGGDPSDAAATPDGRALLVALGGGPQDRGAATLILAGDPPEVAGKLATGPGSHRVRVSKSGRFAAVAAAYGRSVAILERR